MRWNVSISVRYSAFGGAVRAGDHNQPLAVQAERVRIRVRDAGHAAVLRVRSAAARDRRDAREIPAHAGEAVAREVAVGQG
jgi:hypothetical protein